MRYFQILSFMSLCLLANKGIVTSALPFNSSLTEPQNITVCLIYQPPHVRPLVDLVEGQLFGSEMVSEYLEGGVVDLTKVIFLDVLKWNVTYYYTSGFASTLYKTRINNGCDVAASSIFQAGSRDRCNSDCPMPAANFTAANPEMFEPYTCCIDFSQSYYTGGWTLLSRQRLYAHLNYIKVFFQEEVVNAIAVTAVCVFGVAHIAWVLEKSWSKASNLIPRMFLFREKYVDGLADGIWFASSTVLGDVGSSNKLPQSAFGRLIFTLWVMYGMFVLSYITSLISSTLTDAAVNKVQITSISQMVGMRVCLVRGFYQGFFTSGFSGVDVVQVLRNSSADCYAALRNNETDIVFGVREEQIAHFSTGSGLGLLISPTVRRQEYGLAWRDQWEFAPIVNEKIQLYKEGLIATLPTYNDMVAKWYFGDSSQVTFGSTIKSGARVLDWGLMGAALGLVGVYLMLQTFVVIVNKLSPPDPAEGEDEAAIYSQGGYDVNGMPLPAKAQEAQTKQLSKGSLNSKSFAVKMARKLSAAPNRVAAMPMGGMLVSDEPDTSIMSGNMSRLASYNPKEVEMIMDTITSLKEEVRTLRSVQLQQSTITSPDVTANPAAAAASLEHSAHNGKPGTAPPGRLSRVTPVPDPRYPSGVPEMPVASTPVTPFTPFTSTTHFAREAFQERLRNTPLR